MMRARVHRGVSTEIRRPRATDEPVAANLIEHFISRFVAVFVQFHPSIVVKVSGHEVFLFSKFISTMRFEDPVVLSSLSMSIAGFRLFPQTFRGFLAKRGKLQLSTINTERVNAASHIHKCHF